MPNAVGLHGELDMFVRLGLTPVEVLRTATCYAAEALGSGADLGMIEVGEVADIVILDADPLADIRNTREVKVVVKNGRLFGMKMRLSGTTSQP
jgi:imidazolonepropionase-like amidohydrolase